MLPLKDFDVNRKMAFNILHDPYANSYAKQWFDPRAGNEPVCNVAPSLQHRL